MNMRKYPIRNMFFRLGSYKLFQVEWFKISYILKVVFGYCFFSKWKPRKREEGARTAKDEKPPILYSSSSFLQRFPQSPL